MTNKKSGRTVGALFLSAFFLYGGGSFLIASSAGSAAALPENADSLSQLLVGSALLLLNSVAVAAIGALAYRALRHRHPRTANAYVATRVVEAVLLALAPLGTLTLALLTRESTVTGASADSGLQSLALTAVGNGQTAYWLAMATLGVGSLAFCRALLRSGFLPRFLAGWGIVGYAIFALGSMLELAGYGVGLALSVPGGLFEVAAGGYLVLKGFREVAPKVVRGTGLVPRNAPAGVLTMGAATSLSTVSATRPR